MYKFCWLTGINSKTYKVSSRKDEHSYNFFNSIDYEITSSFLQK